jgi:hypothetical protein
VRKQRFLFIGLAALVSLAVATTSLVVPSSLPGVRGQSETLIDIVRTSTEPYQSVDAALAAGYGLLHGCVSGPQEGTMGIHYVNGDLLSDGALDPTQPEALIYEYRDGQLELAGVEYIVFVEDWHASNEPPPVVLGQLFHYAGSPNRYAIPAFYELHVWAWIDNPNGTFTDYNPDVSCDEYPGEVTIEPTNH